MSSSRLLPLLIATIAATSAMGADLPLVAAFPMDGPEPFRDHGGVGFPVHAGNGISAAGDGHSGGCWRFTGKGRLEIGKEGDAVADLIGSPSTVALWVAPDAFPPAHSHTVLLSKRIAFWQGYAFQVMLEPDGQANVSAQNGRDTVWVQFGKLAPGAWTHLAFTHTPDGDLIAWRDGKECGRGHLDGTCASNDLPLLVGDADGNNDDYSRRTAFSGRLDDLRIYAAGLDAATIAAIARGETPATRPARREDLAPNRMPVAVRLVRFDMALGFRSRDGGEPQATRATCQRVDGPDAVDWPRLWCEARGEHGERELFAGGPEERVPSVRKLHQGGGPIFQQDDDAVVHPGDHWYRPLAWLWGQTYVYTTDSSARGTGSELEIWTFPVRIRAAQGGGVKAVKLTCGGRTLYDRTWDQPLDSLTLCLPQNRPGPSYELAVNGSPALPFDAGLKPVTLGDPREEPLPVALALAGAPATRAESVALPERFPFAKELAAQVAEMQARSAPWPKAQAASAGDGDFTRHLGVEVARAPLQTFAESLTHGMSGGFWLDSAHGPRGRMNDGRLFPADAEGYAAFLAGQHLDVVVEQFKSAGNRTPEALAAACLHHGVRVGFNLVSINNANLAYYSRALPDFWLPKLRDAQLVAQRVRHLPNLAGFTIGADNGGYVPYWDWAPPIPNRPWGEAFLAVNGVTGRPQQIIGPGLEPNGRKGYEVKGPQKDFVAYLQRYDATFQQYGQFQARLHEVDPALTLTTGSYGSQPGVLAQGGWPCGSINGEPIFQGLDVLQSYDWDETDAEKPLHNLALMDRLRSWYPDKPAWMLLDDFFLKFGREARQRTVAIGLTRGVEMIGHNWMPQPTGDQAHPELCRDEAEMWAWVHRLSGAYAGTRPRAAIGILYVHDQAASRPIVDPHNAEQMKRASHEGKITEALLLCHLAGWPARIVTTAELARGLPADMSGLLLTGLNRFDGSWVWSDGLEPALAAFAKRGGRLLLDDESVLPAGLTGAATGMVVSATLPQGPAGPDGDKVALACARNAVNAGLLRKAMVGAKEPLAVSDKAAVWAVPHRTGDVDYVTVTSWSSTPGKDSVREYTPASAGLRWTTERPIYDLVAGKLLSAAEAATCDLTKDAVRVYALPPAPLGAPTLTVTLAADGFLATTPVVTAAGKPVAGVPLELIVSGPGSASATLWSASGRLTRLPVSRGDRAGAYTVTCTELCSGLHASASATIAAGGAPAATGPALVETAALTRFLARKDVPLAIALTAAQQADPALQALGERLVAACVKAGRPAHLAAVSPSSTIIGVQPYAAAQDHPKWQTIASDLVLLGDLKSNVLVYDQGLGDLFPPEVYRQEAGSALVRVTCSPFVGNYQCLNVLGADAATLTKAVTAVEATSGR